MSAEVSCILVTGAQGFIGQNLVTRLHEIEGREVLQFNRANDPATLPFLIAKADVVVHLAGENRPSDPEDFGRVNAGLTKAICDAIAQTGQNVPLIFASSAQAALDNPYGQSKRAAEDTVHELHDKTENSCTIFRLPGVFGKWCRPNYNSVVATFCHNIAHGIDIKISGAATPLQLVYIDDVVDALIAAIDDTAPTFRHVTVAPKYTTTVGDLATLIRSIDTAHEDMRVDRVGSGLTRALYATYLSYLPQDRVSYKVPKHGDERGNFVEMVKTADSGQVSYFTALPGVTRGEHYHHTKSEKFLVAKGTATFQFRHMTTQETFEITTNWNTPEVVASIPGWAHNVTNIGTDDLVVVLWANEVFDHARADTIPAKV